MRTLKRRVSLKVIKTQDRLRPVGVEEPVPEAEFPRTRADCAPDPLTVDCPEADCLAAAGQPCTPKPKRNSLGELVLDDDGQPFRDEFDEIPHQARVDLARDGLRPCPWVRCKFHLYLDVDPENGTICFNYPGQELWEIPQTCSLDRAERAKWNGRETTLEEVGDDLNLTRERIRQIDLNAQVQLAVHRELLRPNEDRLRVVEVAAKTVFDGPREQRGRVIVIGNCPKCKTQRYRVKGKWRCACRRQSTAKPT